MFNKNRSAGITFISEDCILKGEMSFIGDVIIHGKIEGDISCDGTITIGKTGSLSGILKANKLFVDGELDGEIKCEQLHVEKHGEIKGQLYCEAIKIDEGGQFFGERKHAEKNQKKAAPAEVTPIQTENIKKA